MDEDSLKNGARALSNNIRVNNFQQENNAIKRELSPMGKNVYYIDDNNLDYEIKMMKKRSIKKMQFFNNHTPSPQNSIFQS